jgi:phage gp45-like
MTAANRLYRRVMMTIMPMKVTATDDTGPVHRAQVRGFPNETIDNMPVLQIYGLASHAMAGSDGMAIFASGDRSNGVIIATGNQKYRLRNLASGEVALYTDEGDFVKLSRGKIIAIKCGTKVHLDCPLVEMTGDLHVTGEVVRGWGTGDQVTLGKHVHTQGSDGHGDAEAPTFPPTPGT